MQDKSGICKGVNGKEENEVVSSKDQNSESGENSAPETTDSMDQSSALQHQGERSSTTQGEWVCPPFSYRQEDATVVFCLHTAGAKESTLVKLFDDYSVSKFSKIL